MYVRQKSSPYNTLKHGRVKLIPPDKQIKFRSREGRMQIVKRNSNFREKNHQGIRNAPLLACIAFCIRSKIRFKPYRCIVALEETPF